MPKYNLGALGPQEFERLCQSLVQQIIGPGAKVYGMGSDGAREATFQGRAPYPSKEEQWEGSWIFQVKFHDVQQIGPKEARRRLLAELDDELSKITKKYRHPCDNFILMTNVSLTPVFQRGIKDRIDNKIIPKYSHAVKHIHVWGAEEICRFLDAYPNIRQSYSHLLVSGDIIARLLGLIEEEETELDKLVRLYCNGCLNREQYAALDDAGDVEDERVALQRVFIDLDVKPPALPQDPQELEKLPEWLKQAAEDDEITSALSYLLDDSIPGLVLIGGPGEGKSTLGQYLAQIHRARLVGRLNELGENVEMIENCTPRIPFRILLREYGQWISSQNNSDSLFHYLAHQFYRESGRKLEPKQIHKIVESNPILLILDGLDEVPEKKLRRRVLDNVTSFVSQVRDVLKGDLRVIATTRPYGYSQEFDPLKYLHLTIQSLSPEKALSYVKRWISARGPNSKDAERIRKTFNLCLEDRVVSVLTQTPLQVTILLVIIRARGTPPKQREELFERYMDIIYQREQKNRPELLRTESEIIYGLHKYLAYILHKRAEKDETAALMDISEFREKVKEYLYHTNPLLNEEELETKTGQIIKEASQRLVLIESPQEGKIGFGLTTTREFFAAAHLVDTAKDTKERDLRFKAIAKSPHWRNVALFFAGRVGRTRPGEAPSMIDVCRQIDTERVDRFLKRGAELVMEIVDDRAIREPHNQIGAIQYGLTVLDTRYIEEYDDLINKLKNLPEEYKDRVVRPWIEEQLNTISPENLEPYADIYRELFAVQNPLLNAIRRASEFPSDDVKLWALSQAVKNGVAGPWVVELLEGLVNIVPIEKIVRTLADHWPNFRLYLDFPLSPKAGTILALALLAGAERFLPRSPSELIDKLPTIKPDGKIKENSLLLWAVSQLLIISRLFEAERRYIMRRDQPVEIILPGLANPAVKKRINKNADFIRDFCKTFSLEDEPFIKFLVAVFGFFLEPHKPEKYVAVSKHLQETEKSVLWLTRRVVSSILGPLPDSEEEMHNYYRDLAIFYRCYESEEQYRKNMEELNELINRKSEKIKNHPHRFLFWINSNCDPEIERFLDSEILSNVKKWLRDRDLSEKALRMCFWERFIVRNDLQLTQLVLGSVARQLEEGRKRLKIDAQLVWYRWHEPKTSEELAVANKLKQILEEVLFNYSTFTDPEHRQLEILYWSALKAGIVQEKHLVELYKIVHTNPAFPSKPWFAEEAESAWSMLVSMTQSDKLEVVRLAAVSLSAISSGSRFFPHEPKKIEEVGVGEKYWELAQDKKDTWHPRYIEGMACCRLKWAENSQEWFRAIKEANTEKAQRAWCKVIEEAGYCEAKDRDALFNLLLHILESGGTFPKPIQFAALRRLDKIVSEVEPVEFDEKPLNLPLSRRRTSVS